MTDPHALLAARFPADFRFGVATSAYQIEGSLEADGRGRSIWETFAERPDAIERGETAAVACDHYRRWSDDVDLIASLGVDSYRFSIAWPRIQPTGSGAINEAGLAFYDRLIDRLLAKGIRPFPTLYHWDLPQALEDSGGWAARDTAERYAEYAALVTSRLSDRVGEWSLFNEPYIFTSRGYLLGRYAPGRRSLRAFLRSVHTVVRAHALGFKAIKAVGPHLKVGTVFAMAPVEPATNSPEDIEAAQYGDALFNHVFADPLMKGAYPQAFLDGIPARALDIREGDMADCQVPLDFIGINCYYRLIISAGENPTADLPMLFFGIRADTRGTGGHADFSTENHTENHSENSAVAKIASTMASSVDVTMEHQSIVPVLSAFGRNEGARTEMGWEIWPRALHDVLVSLNRQYPGIPLHVCESGCAFADKPAEDGVVHDESRIAYHRAHLASVADAIHDGANVRSYHAWSLYDNFEWASGYRPRFGIVHVDYASQKRTLKRSAEWYREMIRASAATRPQAITQSPRGMTAHR